jgi:dipeptidyl aminopeptidase/acylaminoacyl peptidase
MKMNMKMDSNSINGIKRFTNTCIIFLMVFIWVSIVPLIADANRKPLSLQDIMKFKGIHDPIISEKGDWVVYNTKPDRGNGEIIATHIATNKTYSIERGAKPAITKDSRWVAAVVQPDEVELEKATKKRKPKPGMALLETSTGKIITVEKVKGFSFSDDSVWLLYQLYPEKEKEDKQDKDKKKMKEEESKKEKEKKDDKKVEIYTMVLRNLSTGKEIRIPEVSASSFDPASRYLAYSIYNKDEEGIQNGLYVRELDKSGNIEKKIHSLPMAKYSNLAWSKKKSRLAFLLHEKTRNITTNQPGETAKIDIQNESYTSSLMVWDGLKNKMYLAVSKKSTPPGWLIPRENKISWTKDENRVFFGLKPEDEFKWTHPHPQPKRENPRTDKETEKINLYDMDHILKKRGVDIWHWQDPFINPNQKKQWEKYKNRIYPAVYHFKENRYVQLTDQEMPMLQIPENPNNALGLSNRPYQREIAWDGWYNDVYLVSLWNGTRKKILTRHDQDAYLSFHGQFILFYRDKHWQLYDIRLSRTSNLTKSIKTPFYNEDHDYPSDVPGYGMAGWTKDDASVLIYDKYDIWEFSTSTGGATCLTEGIGRENKIAFRILKLDPEVKFFKKNEKLLLSAYSHEKKYSIFYSCVIGKKGIKRLINGQEDKWFRFLEKAKKSEQILYTRENFEEFPDLWVSNLELNSPRKISDVNPQRADFLWGKTELIEWNSLDGIPLQGVVIKPENYDKNKRYPVLVYFYRFMSHQLHRFNQVVINHRPCFPYYAGHGYVIFLPDIRFEVGRPGLAAVKCVVPGVQKLISLGIADPKAISLHGHSWSGYQTAFIVTQTNIFTAAIAGAPVSNMTSAYNGIRWGSGLARQSQYEKGQSRIGRSLIEAPHLYMENSPVFFTHRIHTPLLIQFGDKDEAVPWYQGIELYLTMRRLNKNCIFLQYNDESHHLKKYPNKLDYTIKMKEFLDHYLKGEPAPAWISKGVPYQKKK